MNILPRQITTVGDEPTWGQTIEKMFPSKEPQRGHPALILIFLGVLGATWYFTRGAQEKPEEETDE